MRYSNSEQFVKSNLSEKSLSYSITDDLERDDDDPFSIRSLTITFLGIMVAFLTILLPFITVLLSRPLSQQNEITFNSSIKKDGS